MEKPQITKKTIKLESNWVWQQHSVTFMYLCINECLIQMQNWWRNKTLKNFSLLISLIAAHLWLDGFEHTDIHECDLALEKNKNNKG